MDGCHGERKPEVEKGQILIKKRKRGSESNEEEANIEELIYLIKTLPHVIIQNILNRLNPIELHSCYFFYGVPSHNEMVKKHLDNRWYGKAHRMLNDIKSDVETYHMVILETPLNYKSKSRYADSHYVILTEAMKKMKELGFSRSMELFEKLILHPYNRATTVELYKDMVRECSGTVKPEVYRAVLNAMIDRDIQEAIELVRSILNMGIKFDMSDLVKKLIEELVRKDGIKDVEHILEAFGGCDPVFIEALVEHNSKVEMWEYAYNIVYESAKSKSPKAEPLLKALVSSIWKRKNQLLRENIWQLHILEKCFDIVTIIGKVPDKDTCVPITAALQICEKEEEAMFMFQCGVCELGVNNLEKWVYSEFYRRI